MRNDQPCTTSSMPAALFFLHSWPALMTTTMMAMALVAALAITAGASFGAEEAGSMLVPASPIINTAGPWIGKPTDPASLKGGGKAPLTLEAGWYTAGGPAFGLYPPVTAGVNQGIRARFKYVPGGTADVTVRRHNDASGKVRSYSFRLDEKARLLLVEFSMTPVNNQIERKNLFSSERQVAVHEGDEVLLELIALGDQLVAKLNGQAVGTVTGADTTPGRVSCYTEKMTIGGLEWMVLDGLSDHKARAAIGATQSADIAAPAGAAPKTTMPPPPVVTADADVQQRLTEIDAKFRRLFDQLAGTAYSKGVDQLNLSYLGALKREEAVAQQKGRLKEVLMYQEEAKAVTENTAVGNAESAVPAPIKPMHDSYRKTMIRLETDRDRLSAPAFKAYADALDQFIAELTKAGRIEAAKQVDGVREALKPASGSNTASGS
ncbi:MAG: hypothetical protein JWO94_3206 [Verrucomicrobiaceae bacterium]|nr:hypothetical protein [Verrucomicrobiaceae bacterium]